MAASHPCTLCRAIGLRPVCPAIAGGKAEAIYLSIDLPVLPSVWGDKNKLEESGQVT